MPLPGLGRPFWMCPVVRGSQLSPGVGSRSRVAHGAVEHCCEALCAIGAWVWVPAASPGLLRDVHSSDEHKFPTNNPRPLMMERAPAKTAGWRAEGLAITSCRLSSCRA